MLHNFVVPYLDNKLTKYGESIRFGDLRWGVNTSKLSEEESSKKVLKVCLDQIDDCKPYMIVFIGERYGWIPSQDLIKSAALLKNIEIKEDISVTQLEIEYGALLNPDFEGRILFYFRELDKEGMSAEERRIYEAESPLHKEKITKLKEKIFKLYPNYVRTYKAKWNKESKKVENLDDLQDLIKQDLERIFKIDIEKYNALPWQERAILASHEFFKEKNKGYIDTKTIDSNKYSYNESVFSWLKPNKEVSFVFYSGTQGLGKSSRVAHQYINYFNKSQEDKNVIAIPFAYQIDEYTSNLENLYYIIIYHLEKALNIKHRNYKYNTSNHIIPKKSIINYLVYLIKKLKRTNLKPYVIIDNVSINDIFYVFKQIERRLNSFRHHTDYKNISITFKIALNNENLPSNTPFFDISKSYPLTNLLEEEIDDLIDVMLKNARKELSENVINHLLKKEQAYNPYYLSLILNRLFILDSSDYQEINRLGGDIDSIDNYLISIIDNAGDNIKNISKELIKEIAERINFDFVMKFLSITYYSNIYLSLKEYEEIFSFASWDYDELDATLLLSHLRFLFKKNKNAEEFTIKNKEVLNGLKELINEYQYNYVLDILFKYLRTLPNNHPLKGYDLFFALASKDGVFIAEYYLKNVKLVKNPSLKHLKIYKNYISFIVDLVNFKNYDVLLDFYMTLVKNNASVKHYYLVQALTKYNLNEDEKAEFHYFYIDLLKRIRENKYQNDFADALYVYSQLQTCISLQHLESDISFDRLLLIYNYCAMNNSKLPKELINEVIIALLRSANKMNNLNENYALLKMYFDEMISIDEKMLNNVVFKDYQKYMIKGYIARLIYGICLKQNDEIYKKYEKIYINTLNICCNKDKLYNISFVAQETYYIGYFHHGEIYVDFNYHTYLTEMIDFAFSDNVYPLLKDIDECLTCVSYLKYKNEKHKENMLLRAYKKTCFLNEYYSEYKSNMFLVISTILNELNSIDQPVLDRIIKSIESTFIMVIKDRSLSFEGGSDEFISSAVMNHLEYFAYIIYLLYLYDKEEENKKILINIFAYISSYLEKQNPYINIVIYTLLLTFASNKEDEEDQYLEKIEESYDSIDKEDSLYINHKYLINACLLYIYQKVSFDEFVSYLTNLYNKKINTDRYVNY